MDKVIAQCAERIVAVLGEEGAVNVLLISERIGERSIVAYQALGWLARDGRISYEARGNQVYVSLPALPPEA